MTNVNLLGENKSVLWTVLSKLKQNLGLWNFPGNTGESDAFVTSFAGSHRENKNSLSNCKLLMHLQNLCALFQNMWWM